MNLTPQRYKGWGWGLGLYSMQLGTAIVTSSEDEILRLWDISRVTTINPDNIET
ncbi:hypothetical protein [Nostoc sp. LPT]|uniref:hypothetical protein n=1 Tax=Nostoc sp. LPT TaxID=2815387 RepID=UPI001D8E5F32|nr:hypothetical protein [Nostoc sp. LPT]MBN4005123.1 hypothetical protein [Nostoc sp. LPT]